MCGLVAIPGDQLLSFACPKESNPRKGHPRGRGLPGILARQTPRAGSGVRSRHIRVPRSDARASCARPRAEHAADPAPARRGREGTRKSRARQSLPQKHRIYPTRRFCFALGFPLSSGGGRTEKPREARAARGTAPIRTTGHGWPVGRTRPPAANPRLRRGRESEGAFFFGYFLLGKQKKVTGRHGWRPNHTRT